MVLLIVIILVAAAVTGTLGGVLEVAAGVVLGLVLFVVGIGVAVWWYLRRRMRAFGREIDRVRGTRAPPGDHPGDRPV